VALFFLTETTLSINFIHGILPAVAYKTQVVLPGKRTAPWIGKRTGVLFFSVLRSNFKQIISPPLAESLLLCA